MDMEIANRLQQLRAEKGYSQEELAEKLEISRQAVSKWERGESSPDTDNLIRLAKLYNMSLDELLNVKNCDNQDKQSDEAQPESDAHVNISFRRGKAKKYGVLNSVLDGIFVLTVTILFLVFGCVFGRWYDTWIMFLLIPVFHSILEMIEKRRITEFCYPVFVTALYLFLGMDYALWHPMWILFITIPVFYVIFDPIDKYLLKTKPIKESDDDDEDDEDDEDDD